MEIYENSLFYYDGNFDGVPFGVRYSGLFLHHKHEEEFMKKVSLYFPFSAKIVGPRLFYLRFLYSLF